MRSNLVAAILVAGLMIMTPGCLKEDAKNAGPTTSSGGNNSNNTTAPPPVEFVVTAKDYPGAQDTTLMTLKGAGTVKAGANVTFVLKGTANNQFTHNLVITGPAGSNISNLKVVSGVKDNTAGVKSSMTYKLTAGSYSFFCDVNPGQQPQTSHKSLGMQGTLTVA